MDYVFTPAIGVKSLRLNLQRAQVIPKGDVSTTELVPVKFQDALVRVEASTLEVGHVVAQLDSNVADPLTGPLINIVFQVIQVVVKTSLVTGFSLLRRIQDHDFCPMDLKYEDKVDDHVMIKIGRTCHALFGLLPGHKPFSPVVAKVSAGSGMGVGGGCEWLYPLAIHASVGGAKAGPIGLHASCVHTHDLCRRSGYV